MIDELKDLDLGKWFASTLECRSSYRENNIGWIIYSLAASRLGRLPKGDRGRILELGVLDGYSTLFLGLAAKGYNGSVVSVDIFESYPYNHADEQETRARIARAGLASAVTIDRTLAENFVQICQHEAYDVVHVDISNDGDIFFWAICKVVPLLKIGGIMIFEGGSAERDQVDWMKKYNKRPINSLLACGEADCMWPDLKISVIDIFPSITIVERISRGKF